MRAYIVLVLILTFSFSAQSATVKQVLDEKNLVLVELQKNEKVQIGDYFIAATDSKQCLLKVIQTEKNTATLSSDECKNKISLSKSQKIEKSLFAPELIGKETKAESTDNLEQITPTENKEAQKQDNSGSASLISEDESYFAFVLGSNIGNRIYMRALASNGTNSETGSIEYTLSNSLSIGFEWSQFYRQNWNHGFQVDYSKADFDDYTLTGSVSGSTTGRAPGSLSLLTLAYSGKYRWENFYLPIGFGLTGSNADSEAAFTKTLRSLATAWIGIGLAPSKNFSIELLSRATSIQGDTVVSNGVTLSPDTGALSGLQLNIKIKFN